MHIGLLEDFTVMMIVICCILPFQISSSKSDYEKYNRQVISKIITNFR